MNWIQDRKTSLEWSIKFTRKALFSQLSVQAFNIAGMCWNGWWLMHSTSGLSSFGFGLGAFMSNTLWTTCFCAKYWGEIRGEQAELRFINELDLKEKLHEDREFYQKARKNYEDFFTRQNNVGGDQPAQSTSDGYSDKSVCVQADANNCH